MGVPYKLQRRRNPLKPTEPGQWHAVPKTGKAVKEKVMTRMATEDTTVADVELIAAAKLIGKFIHNQTIQGKRVRVPGLGSFRMSFGSTGVDDITKFNTNMIRNVKIVFVMDQDLRSSILNDLSFENAGVDDEGVQYASLENYKEVKGLSPSGGGQTTPGGEGSGEGGEGSGDDGEDLFG